MKEDPTVILKDEQDSPQSFQNPQFNKLLDVFQFS